MSDNNDDNIDGLMSMVMDQFNVKGCTSVAVKEGRLWMFKRSFLEALLAKYPDREVFDILIKTRSFEN